MHNLQRLFSTFLLMVAVPTCLSLSPVAAAEIDVQPQLNWNQILRNFRRQGEPRDKGSGGLGGGRPTSRFCAIAPVQEEQVWSVQPLLIWQENIQTIGLRRSNEREILWRRTVPKDKLKSVLYPGAPLQPGQSYDWLFFLSEASTSPLFWIRFQVVNRTDHATIKADLEALEAKLKAQKANAEAIALQRANYFAQRQLWADVLQEIYSVKNPSAELKRIAPEITAQACRSSPD